MLSEDFLVVIRRDSAAINKVCLMLEDVDMPVDGTRCDK